MNCCGLYHGCLSKFRGRITEPYVKGAGSETELNSGTSSTGDLSSTHSKSSKTSASYAATTLPSEKRSGGFMKRLPFTSRKKITSGSATVHKIPEHRSGSSPHRDTASHNANTLPSRDSSPSARNLKKNKSNGSARSLPSPALKQLSSDNAEEEDLPTSLPPPMDIVEVGSKLEPTSGSCSSACSVASESSNPGGASGDVFGCGPPDSLSSDLRHEMENIIQEKFPTSSTQTKSSQSDEWASKITSSHPSESTADESGPNTAADLSNGSAPSAENGRIPEVEKAPKDEIQTALERRKYVLLELIETEKEYVNDLATLTNGYMVKVLEKGLTQDPGKERVVFGNIAQIYEWHRDSFQKEIEKCLEHPDRLGALFNRYERRLHMYVKYCQNKPLSEYLVLKHKTPYFTDIQQELGTKLHIADYLIKPVQRIMKYQLLLKDFLKFTERAKLDCSDLKAAVHVMYVVPKLANDMMMVARMKSFPGRITAQGKLILQDTFQVSHGASGAAKERKVFFFEQSVVLADLVDKKAEERGFTYKSSIKISNLSIKELGNSPNRFCLVKRDSGDVLELCASEAQTKEIWVEKIKQQLENQMDFLNALSDPISTQRRTLESTSSVTSNNSNNNNSARRGNGSPRLMLPTFRPNTHTNINLNCKLGGEVTTKRSSLDGAISADRSGCSALDGGAETAHPPPGSKQNNSNASFDENDNPRPKTPPFPVTALDQLETLSSNAKEQRCFETFEETPLLGDSPVQPGSAPFLDSANRNNFLFPRPTSAVDTSGSMGRLRSASTLSSHRIRKQSNNSHQSAPDLSGSKSFWLSPLSPANIKTSTCKFVYPSEDQNSDAISLSSSQTFSTIRSSKDISPEKVVVVATDDYQAEREDEISVKKGETFDVIATNAQGLCLLHRAATKSSPGAEGWVPGYIVGRGSNASKKGRVTPRVVKRNNAKKPASSPGPLKRILRRARSSDKLADKLEQNTLSRRHNSADLLDR